jgi:transcription initiation factor IIE alpha subunit
MTRKEQVYQCLAKAKTPLTDEEIAERLKLSSNSVRPRRIELEKELRVCCVGEVLTPSGRNAMLWTTDKKAFKILGVLGTLIKR